MRQNLQFQGLEIWVDSQELRAGDKLEPQIKKAIEDARAFILVFSLKTINSDWVRYEVNHALKMQKKKEKYPVIPLMLEGVELAALGKLDWCQVNYFSVMGGGTPPLPGHLGSTRI